MRLSVFDIWVVLLVVRLILFEFKLMDDFFSFFVFVVIVIVLVLIFIILCLFLGGSILVSMGKLLVVILILFWLSFMLLI